MARPAIFVQDCGIYGKQERKGFKTHDLSPFVVFKPGDDAAWTIGQERSGLVILAMVPLRVPRQKRALLAFVETMEKECPEACAMLSLADGFPMHKDIRPYGSQLIDWAKTYKEDRPA